MISVKQLRENFDQVKKDLENGKSFVLLYRSRPLAELKPYNISVKQDRTVEEKKALIKKLSGSMPTEKEITLDDINSILDKSYEHVLS